MQVLYCYGGSGSILVLLCGNASDCALRVVILHATENLKAYHNVDYKLMHEKEMHAAISRRYMKRIYHS